MPEAFDSNRITAALQELLASIPDGQPDTAQISATRARRLVGEISKAIDRLTSFSHSVNPIRQPPDMFDPYLPENMGRLIGQTMLEQAGHPLENLPKFYGAGVYAIFYRGFFDAYAPISGSLTPIYVEKADPADSLAKTAEEQDSRLHGRLRDHSRSIAGTANLSLNEFSCRYLVIRSGLQAAAEGFLLRHFRPIWNEKIMNGFGKHGDSPLTRKNTRAEWDSLHPGRAWATREGNQANPIPIEAIKLNIATHFSQFPPST